LRARFITVSRTKLGTEPPRQGRSRILKKPICGPPQFDAVPGGLIRAGAREPLGARHTASVEPRGRFPLPPRGAPLAFPARSKDQPKKAANDTPWPQVFQSSRLSGPIGSTRWNFSSGRKKQKNRTSETRKREKLVPPNANKKKPSTTYVMPEDAARKGGRRTRDGSNSYKKNSGPQKKPKTKILFFFFCLSHRKKPLRRPYGPNLFFFFRKKTQAAGPATQSRRRIKKKKKKHFYHVSSKTLYLPLGSCFSTQFMSYGPFNFPVIFSFLT